MKLAFNWIVSTLLAVAAAHAHSAPSSNGAASSASSFPSKEQKNRDADADAKADQSQTQSQAQAQIHLNRELDAHNDTSTTTCDICAGVSDLIPDRRFVDPTTGVVTTCGDFNATLHHTTNVLNCTDVQETYYKVCCDVTFEPCGMCASSDSSSPASYPGGGIVPDTTVALSPIVDPQDPFGGTQTCRELGFVSSTILTATDPHCWIVHYASAVGCGCPGPLPDPPAGTCTVCPDGNAVDTPEKEFMFIGPDGTFGEQYSSLKCYQAEIVAYQDGICGTASHCPDGQYCRRAANDATLTQDECTPCPPNAETDESICGSSNVECLERCGYYFLNGCGDYELYAATHCCENVGPCHGCPGGPAGLANPDFFIPDITTVLGPGFTTCGDVANFGTVLSEGTVCSQVVGATTQMGCECVSNEPSEMPSDKPSARPSDVPSDAPSSAPTSEPSRTSSSTPSDAPTSDPTSTPSSAPSDSRIPTKMPTPKPTEEPSGAPSPEEEGLGGDTSAGARTATTAYTFAFGGGAALWSICMMGATATLLTMGFAALE